MTTQEPTRKLAAIFSADVKGYSRLLGEDELGTIRTLNAHKELMSQLIREHRGRVVDAPGDNLLAEFGSVVDAVRCAVEVQKQLSAANSALPENRRMEFRIGVNLGDVVEEENRLYGDGVNIAARLEGLADGGGVCISGTAFDQVRNKLTVGYEFRGEQTVKNIAEPVRVYRVLTDPQAAGKVIGETKIHAGVSESLNAHYDAIVKTIIDGRVVLFIGEGANLCGRPTQTKWAHGRSDNPPSSTEVAEHLARSFEYPPNAPLDLVRVSQYVSVVNGSGPLYEELHSLFDADYEPTPLHRYIASLPAMLRDKGYAPRYPLVVTTNYDDALERAFVAASEPFDLVAYAAEGEQRGKFIHFPPDGEACVIERPNEYRGLSLDQRSVILKIHGAVDRREALWDSFVITEDHYINYLTRTDISSLLPVTLAAKLRKSHFLFLGYSLRDWNLRVILHRIWGEQKLTYKSWAILEKLELMEKDFWRSREVDVFTIPLDAYVAVLEERLRQLRPMTDHG
jgi:class 3 adenylate cyclase